MKNKEIKLQLLIGWESSIYEMGYDISKITKEEIEEIELVVCGKLKENVDVIKLVKEALEELRVPKVRNQLEYTVSLTTSKSITIPSYNKSLSEEEINNYRDFIERTISRTGFTVDDISIIQD